MAEGPKKMTRRSSTNEYGGGAMSSHVDVADCVELGGLGYGDVGMGHRRESEFEGEFGGRRGEDWKGWRWRDPLRLFALLLLL